MVDVRRPGADKGPAGGQGGNIYHLSGNMMTPEFWARITSEVAAGEARVRGDVPGLAIASVKDAQERFAL